MIKMDVSDVHNYLGDYSGRKSKTVLISKMESIEQNGARQSAKNEDLERRSFIS